MVVRIAELFPLDIVEVLCLLLELAQGESKTIHVVGLMLQHIFFDDLFDLLLGFILLPLFVVHLVNYQLVVFGFNPE
jgi:hypothetical protein